MRYRIIPDRIAEWRHKEGRSIVWLSRQIGVTPESLYDQIAGRYGVSLRTALQLERTLGVPVRDLVEEVV